MTERKPVTVITLADVLCYVRNQLITAIEQKDAPKINSLASVLQVVKDAAIAYCPPKNCDRLHPILDHMMSAIDDYFHGETWKSTIPTVEEIQAAFRGNVSESVE